MRSKFFTFILKLNFGYIFGTVVCGAFSKLIKYFDYLKVNAEYTLCHKYEIHN